MSKEMVISANPHETRVAILEEGQLCEYYVERDKEFALVGSIYKGKVTRVLPGMQSAFVEIGLDSDAFLYVSDFLEEIEGLDHVETTPDPSKTAAAVEWRSCGAGAERTGGGIGEFARRRNSERDGRREHQQRRRQRGRRWCWECGDGACARAVVQSATAIGTAQWRQR